MTRRLRQWLQMKWRAVAGDELARAYAVTFSTPQGQLVLQDMLDRLYCQVYEGTDPQAAAIHNAKRSVVQDMLWNIEQGERPRLLNTVTEDPIYAGSHTRSTSRDRESQSVAVEF